MGPAGTSLLYNSTDPASESESDMGRLGDAGHESIYASTWEILTPYIAEFLGTFIITVTFLSNYDDSADTYFSKYSTGFMIIAVVCATKHITGANLNPSVTIALGLSGRLRPRAAFCLCLTQVLAAIAAAFLLSACGVANNISLGPLAGHSWTQLAITETVYASMLCFVYLNCASSKRNNPKSDQNGFVGLCYGLCYVASSNAARGICDIVSNSAIAVALVITNGHRHALLSTGLSYVCYDVIAAVVGVGAYRVVRPSESRLAESLPTSEVSVSNESAQMASEFLGAFFIILTQVLGASSETNSDLGPRAWATGSVVIVMVCSLQTVSGAHFNPAVTLAVRASGRSTADNVPVENDAEFRIGIFYCLAHILAGIAAATMGLIMTGGQTNGSDIAETTTSQAFISELAITFFLCYVVLATSVTSPVAQAQSKQNNICGIAYGSIVLSNTLAVGNISGALMNPAAVVAFVFLGVLDTQASLLPYFFYHGAAGVLAAAAFLTTHAQLYVKDAHDADDKLHMGS